MGNRAIIKGVGTNIGVYVHWNGGYDSVLAFTQYCKLKGYRSLESNPAYGTARLAQTIGNYFGGGLSVGIENMSGTTVMTPELVREFYLDNGVYEIKDLLVRTEEDKMINEFKKYDKEHTRLVTISVSDFNELIKETNISIETKRDYDLRSLESINDMNKKIGEPEINLNEYRNMYYGVSISIVNNRNDNIPATITIAKFLDLMHIDIRWNAFDGNKVDLEYKI